MFRRLFLLLVLFGIAVPTASVAEQVTYNFSGSFNPSATGSYSGFYVYDTNTGDIVDARVEVTSGLASDGATTIPQNTYILVDQLGNQGFTFSTAIPVDGNRGGSIIISPNLGAPTSVQVLIDAVCTSSCNSYDSTASGARFAYSGAVSTVAPVPTLSEWSLILLTLIMAGVAAHQVQRRRVIR